MNFLKTRNIVFIALVVVGLLSAAGFYGFVNSTRTEGIQYETAISAQYQVNQNELSTYVVSIKEQVGIANLKSAKIDTILRHAVEGRYGEDGFKPNGAMFSAIQEAYPDMTQNLALFDRIAESVRAGRTEFKQKQDRLLDQVRVYKTFMSDGLVRQFVVKNMLGFPSDNLQARIGAKVVTGKDALDQIQVIVLTTGVAENFSTGTMDAIVK